MTQVVVALNAGDGDRDMGRYSLPTHTTERLIAETHADAVRTGALANDGAPLEDVRISLVGEGGSSPALAVEIFAGGTHYTGRFESQSIGDDAQVLVSGLCMDGTIPTGKYNYVPVSLASEKRATGGLKLSPFRRSLPTLPVISLEKQNVSLPHCPHPAIFLPRRHAEGLVAQAQAQPDIEVGALLVVTPFLIAESVPHRLGVFVRDAVALAEGTVGEALRLRITPAALAAVKVDASDGTFRGGLAHSHPLGDADDEQAKRGRALFLSQDDLAFATAFFWKPFQIQLVIDVRESDPEQALGAFCWVNGRLSRVCFQILNQERLTGAQGEMIGWQ
jgi:hypothetical protein